MADKVAAGHVGGANGAREAVCIHTKKIYSSCRDKDCIEDLRFYPTATAQSVLSTAQGLRGGSAELIYTFVDVEPVNFNRGYYTVDMHFFYRITLQALNGSTRYTEIEGLATFDKRVVLFGSESGAKIYSSIPEANAIDAPLNLTANLPTASCCCPAGCCARPLPTTATAAAAVTAVRSAACPRAFWQHSTSRSSSTSPRFAACASRSASFRLCA